MVAFLDGKLPDCCDIYDHAMTCLLGNNPNYRIYYSTDSSGQNTAIVGTKKDWRRLTSNGELKRVWLFSAWAIDESTKLEAYKSIPDIDWQTDEFIFTGPDCEPDPRIIALFVDYGRDVILHRMDLFVMDRRMALNIELRARDDVYVKSLEPHHAAKVYDNWLYKDTTIMQAVVDSVVESPSAGVFLKATDELVSWMTNFLPTGLSQLHTKEECRQRGYATYVTQYLTKRTAQAGYVPYAIISIGNESSKRCLEGVGFQSIRSYHICEAKYVNLN